MKTSYFWFLWISLCAEALVARGQSGQVPKEVNTAFGKMFPAAMNVEWREKTANFTAYFTLDQWKCEAKFAKTGGWLSTEETMPWDSLPRPVQHGFKESKYADWRAASAYCLRSSEGITQYHIVVTKSDIGRKILFFSQEGKLLMDH